jgi:hypothetical protein
VTAARKNPGSARAARSRALDDLLWGRGLVFIENFAVGFIDLEDGGWRDAEAAVGEDAVCGR